MSLVLTLLIYGILLSGIYLVISIGLSLIFGVMNVVNFAHGVFVMVGGYITWGLFTYLGVHPLLSIVAIIPFMGILGYLIQDKLLEYIHKSNEIYSLLLTFGLAIAIEGGLYLQFTTTERSIVYLTQRTEFLGISLTLDRLVTGIFGWLCVLILFIFLSRSTFGQAIRATAQETDLAEACGINTTRIRATTFAIGTILAGLAGFSYLVMYNVSPQGGMDLLLIAFIIVVLGGMSSLRGTAVAALIVGTFEIFGSFYIGGHLTYILMFLGIAVMLIIRPHGLFGQPEGRYAR